MRKLFLILLLGCGAAVAQSLPVVTVSADPSGACTNERLLYNIANGKLWGCQGGTWAQIGGTGAPSGPAGGVLNGTYPNPGFASTTGSGAVVLVTSPTLVTPNLGTPSTLVLTNASGLPNAGLINAATTVNGQTCTLGAACTIAAGGVTPTSGTFAALPACSTSVLVYFFTNSFYSLARCDGASAWHYFLSGKELTPMVTGSFSFQNGGTSTDTTTFGGNILAYQNSGSTGTAAVRGFFENYPGGTFTITTSMTWNGLISLNNNAGLGISDGTAYEWMRLVPINSGGSGLFTLDILSCTTNTCSSNTSVSAAITIPYINTPFWMRLQDDGTNRIWSWSTDGTTWNQKISEGRTAQLTPTKIGLVADPQSTTDVILTVPHFLQGP